MQGRRRAGIALGRLRLSREATVVAAAAAVFVLLSIWWLLYDKRIPGGGDPGTHIFTALDASGYLKDLDLGSIFDLGPIGTQFFYPPAVHVIGAVPLALGLGPAQDWATIAINLVFVPMLAAGTYLCGRRIYGRFAGMLAALFALTTPMVLSLFHIFVTDTPLAGAVAVCFAALLYSERFSSRKMTIVAGALVGFAVLVKTAAPLYLVGPVAVMLIGGGWKQWRNLALGALAALIVAGPYYLVHFSEVTNLGQETTVGPEIGAVGTTYDRDARISFDNFTWYIWSAINEQYFVPFLLLFAAGFVTALRDLRRRFVPELLSGVVVTYLALVLLLSVRDARYTLPLLVYIAVISTGWIATTSRLALRRIGLAVLALAATLNVAASLTDALPTLRASPGGPFQLGRDPGSFTFLDDAGYLVGAPQPDPFWTDLLSAAKRDGLEYGELRTLDQTYYWGDDPVAFDGLLREYEMREPTLLPGTPEPDFIVYTWPDYSLARPASGGRPLEACTTIEEGSSYQNGESVNVSVVVIRREAPGRYERWCEF